MQPVSNIGPKARRVRAIMGVFSLALALILWLWLTLLAQEIEPYLPVLCPVLPTYVGLLGILQAQRKT